MSEPLIKIERLSESPIGTVSPIDSATFVSCSPKATSFTNKDADIKPPKLKHKTTESHEKPGSSANGGGHINEVDFDQITTFPDCASTIPSPVPAGLPSRSSRAVATRSVITTTRSKNLLSTLKLPNHSEQTPKTTKKATFAHSNNMEEEYIGTGDDSGFENMPISPPEMDVQVVGDEMVLLPLSQLQGLHARLEQLQDTSLASAQKLSEQRAVITELITCSRNTCLTIQGLNDRINKLEYENMHFKSLLAPESSFERNERQLALHHDNTYTSFQNQPVPHNQGHQHTERSNADTPLHGTSASRIKKRKSRKQLSIKIPMDAAAPAPSAGLPTPSMTGKQMRVFSSPFPNTPITPGIIGPVNINKRSINSMHKRAIHNLDKIMPPSNVCIPLVPLTDTEIIVFFFQSLSRPIVSLRLYARGWGPAVIVKVLNDHREIEPEYLRNTCSVKCTTSIKKGIQQFGAGWDPAYREVFKTADDIKATDLIQLTGDELDHTIDIDLRSLCVGLKKHPHEGTEGGIFTKCVKHCEETDDSYTIGNVWQLAAKLEQDSTLQYPAFAPPTRSGPPTKYSISPTPGSAVEGVVADETEDS